jgi:hypothetical protein
MHTKSWYRTLSERDHLEEENVDGVNIKMDLKEIEWRGVD